jgi:CheY-like chemotaxis protein
LVLEVKQDLIIVDIIMAGEHGYAAIEDLKRVSALASIPIVIFSGVIHRWGEMTASLLDGLLTEAD